MRHEEAAIHHLAREMAPHMARNGSDRRKSGVAVHALMALGLYIRAVPFCYNLEILLLYHVSLRTLVYVMPRDTSTVRASTQYRINYEVAVLAYGRTIYRWHTMQACPSRSRVGDTDEQLPNGEVDSSGSHVALEV